MNQDSDHNFIQRGKTDHQIQKFEKFSSQSFNGENEIKQSIQTTDWDTKASSGISSGTHQLSFEFSESNFQNDQKTGEDFLREELMLQRKIIKKQLNFKQQCFTNEFARNVLEGITKFTTHPTTNSFSLILQQLKIYNINMFLPEEAKNSPTSAKYFSFKQVMESLIFERKNWFFIYTFDLLVCHLTFFIVLIAYWVSAQTAVTSKPLDARTKRHSGCEITLEVSTKHNIISIVKAYIKSHPQQINQNQALFLTVLFFMDVLKSSNPNQSEILSNLQKDLVNDIKILRRIQRKERSFFKFNTEHSLQSKISKYQDQDLFITSPDSTYSLIRNHVLENFAQEVITKYYDLDSEARKNYQLKKDVFCLWMLETIMREGNRKHYMIHRNVSMYILQLMGVLKKLKKQNNIEGISYLIPVVANLKMLLPKVWRHVVKKRPEIEIKLNHYSDFLLKNKFQIEELGHNGVIWGETIYIMAEKMVKFISHKKGINLTEHQKFYDQFLSQIFYYRHRAKEIVSESISHRHSQSMPVEGFNLNSLQNFLVKKYSKLGIAECWNELSKHAEKINQSMSESFVSDIFDYWFVGSTQKYKKVDL